MFPSGDDFIGTTSLPPIPPIVPLTVPNPTSALPKLAKDSKNDKKRKREKSETPHLRKAAGKVWNDPTLKAWPENDHRVFCGDLGNEVTDETLASAFRHYQSFNRARVVRDNRTGKTKGYGFVSFGRPEDMLAAIKEMNRKYVGNRPIRVIKSKWRVRDIDSEKNRADAGQLQILPTNSKHLRRFKILQRSAEGGSAKGESTVNRTFATDYWLNRFKEGAGSSVTSQP